MAWSARRKRQCAGQRPLATAHREVLIPECIGLGVRRRFVWTGWGLARIEEEAGKLLLGIKDHLGIQHHPLELAGYQHDFIAHLSFHPGPNLFLERPNLLLESLPGLPSLSGRAVFMVGSNRAVAPAKSCLPEGQQLGAGCGDIIGWRVGHQPHVETGSHQGHYQWNGRYFHTAPQRSPWDSTLFPVPLPGPLLASIRHAVIQWLIQSEKGMSSAWWTRSRWSLLWPPVAD